VLSTPHLRVLVGAASLAVPLLGEPQIAQEAGVHPLEGSALPLAQSHRLLDAVAVVLVALVVRGVVV